MNSDAATAQSQHWASHGNLKFGRLDLRNWPRFHTDRG